MSKKYTWELDFKKFSENIKTIRSPQYCDDYYRMSKRILIGCHYYLYVDENLNIFNPYTKKNAGKKVFKSFVSTSSREEVIKDAYKWILIYAAKHGLYNAKYYLLTFRVNYRQDVYNKANIVTYPFNFPYNGDDKCFFNNIRDEVGSNGTDIISIEFMAQEIVNSLR